MIRVSFATLFSLAITGSVLAEQRVIFRDGFELTGDVEIAENRAVVLLRAGPRNFQFSARTVLATEPFVPPTTPTRFTLEQPAAKALRPIEPMGRILRVTDFDEYGRRSVVFQDLANREITVHQAITELYPSHAVLRGVNRVWTSAIGLSRIPGEQLLAVLKRAAASGSASDRTRLVQFLIEAGRFAEAKGELERFEKDFGEKKGEREELTARLQTAAARRTIELAEKALAVDQPLRAQKLHQSLEAVGTPPSLRTRADAVGEKIEALDASLRTTRQAIQSSAATAADSEAQEVLDRAMGALAELATPATLPRFGPLRVLADQPEITVEDRAALAISGFLLGPELAHRNLGDAILLYRQAELAMKAMLGDNEAAEEAIARLAALKPRGDQLVEMLPRLPAPPVGSAPDKPIRVALPVKDSPELVYWVLLPPEYDRTRPYPAVVVLHASGGSPESELRIWSSQAALEGYLLVAPSFRLDPTRPYGYSIAEHQALLAMMVDARKRFSIDADRTFLSGHEIGAFAAWDFGMAHPDQFAGLAPIAGSPLYYCKHYWPNLGQLPLYCVEGSLNGDNPSVTLAQFQRYFTQGYPALYVEYPGRGREAFQDELPTLFDWMNRRKRARAPREFEAVSARLCDQRFYWLEIDAFLPRAVTPPELFDQSKVRPARLEGRVTDANSVLITTSGLESASVLLPAGLVHLADPALTVRVNRKVVHKGPLEPDVQTMVREVRRTGDRQRIIVRRIPVPRI